MEPIKLVAGLGNPGRRYTKTRHNAGFQFIEALLKHYGYTAAELKNDKKLKAEIAKLLTANGNKVYLARPQTYMNLSGESIQLICNYFKITAQQILVVHDDIHLEPGIVKFKEYGGHGGHNGLRNIAQQLNTNQFWRLRIGVGHHSSQTSMTNYVLGEPSSHDKQCINQAFEEVLTYMDTIVEGNFSKAMQVLHQK